MTATLEDVANKLFDYVIVGKLMRVAHYGDSRHHNLTILLCLQAEA